jgi:hypothetical protein
MVSQLVQPRGGTRAARRSIGIFYQGASGSKMKCVVPSQKGARSSWTTRPSGARERRLLESRWTGDIAAEMLEPRSLPRFDFDGRMKTRNP